jgi:hypothetical protein
MEFSEVLSCLDEGKAIEIDDNDFEMHFGVETVQVPNSNDDSDYFKVMIDETIIHSSNFLCPPQLSYFTSSHMHVSWF